MGVVLFENSNISRIKNVQISIYYFNLLKSNGEHGISYKTNENRYKY